MSSVFIRRVAPWACAWMLGMPSVHAAEDALSGRGTSAPFAHYQGWRDEPLLDWREANRRVGAIGGWRTYLRESQQDTGPQDTGGADRGGLGDHHPPHHGH